MSSYNLHKAADRARYRQDHADELAAVEAGCWPRDINDQMRWVNIPSMPYAPPAVVKKATEEYVARMCRFAIAYIDGLESRIKAADPNLTGHEL